MDDQPDPWLDEMTDELSALVKPELAPGERLLWASRADRPSPSAGESSRALGLRWSLILGAFGVICFFWAASLDSRRFEGIQSALVIAGIIAGLISSCVLLATLAGATSRARERRRLAGRLYALTDSRAMIWEPMPNSAAVTIHTFSRGTIEAQHLRRVQFPDGSGDVLFRNEYNHPPGFLGVGDVRRVEDLIRRFLMEPATESRPEPEPSHFDL